MDNLRKLLEAAYVDEGLPFENADKFSTKEVIITIVKNCEHGNLKTILEAGNFSKINDAVSKYIHCSTEITGSIFNISVFYHNKSQPYRGNNFS